MSHMLGVSNAMLLAQAIGGVAFIFGVSAFLHKDDYKFKQLLLAQSFMLTAHFFLLGANGATIACIVTGARNFSSLFRKMNVLAPLFVAFYIVFGIHYYGKSIDMLPIIGSIVSTIGIFYLKKIPMRLCSLFSTSLWIVHNYLAGSIGPFFMELFIFTANMRTIYSLYQTRSQEE